MKHRKTLEQSVLKFIADNELIPRSSKILIGLSGGADSVFALHFLRKYSKKLGIEIAALHVNHNLRAKESIRDEEFCKNLCGSLNVEYFSSSIDVKSFARRTKKSLEEAGRELRYSEFSKTAGKCGADLIVTAHNNNDNTETVLLNLLTGSGIDGMSGIPVKRDNIIRPFLPLLKEDIVDYLRTEKIRCVEDSSNMNMEFKRNFLRNSILPAVRRNVNPLVDKVILNSSKIFSNHSKIIESYISAVGKDCVIDLGPEVQFLLAGLKNYPDEILGELLKYVFKNKFNKEFTFDISEKVLKLVKSQVGTKVNLGNRIFALRERSVIVISKEFIEDKFSCDVSAGEKIKFKNSIFSVKPVSRINEKYNSNPMIEFIEADNIKGKMKLRSWKKGDRMQMLGMKGTKKVSDVLTDLKISNTERSKKLVLEFKEDIIWLVGHRISEKYKIKSTTNKIYKLCLD